MRLRVFDDYFEELFRDIEIKDLVIRCEMCCIEPPNLQEVVLAVVTMHLWEWNGNTGQGWLVPCTRPHDSTQCSL